MSERKRVVIEWSEPLTLEEAEQLTDLGDPTQTGIYQVYGHHLVFGANSLLYIGRAIKQPFGTRLRQHERGWLEQENDVHIRVGWIRRKNRKGLSKAKLERLIEDVEALTILWHTPPYNSQNINSYGGQKLWIQCTGNRGSLLPEYTNKWAPARPEGN